MNVIDQLNRWGGEGRPCFFLFDFEFARPIALPLDQIDPTRILFDFRGVGNQPSGLGAPGLPRKLEFRSLCPPGYPTYRQAFSQVQKALTEGYSYLLNLCAATDLKFMGDLDEIFAAVRAPYRLRLRWDDPGNPDFVVFSPESFVRISDNQIQAFPMKGSLHCQADDGPAAAERLLGNAKELAEHITVVDLLRNDLGRVAERVRVDKFRYLEEIRLPESRLLQTSSAISGDMAAGWQGRLGSLLQALLPAGSICGAPKTSTVRVIQAAEAKLGGTRGFYTGVAGIFDGQNLDSAVLIRFLEDHGPVAEGWRRGRFRSGGGITVYSDPRDEYRELLAKVALPQAPLLMETIRIEDGKCLNREYHRSRLWASLRACYGQDCQPHWNFDEIIDQAIARYLESGSAGRWRCRLVYTDQAVDWSLSPYQLRRPQRLYLVEIGRLEYSHKYADRSALESLRAAVAKQIGAVSLDWDLLLLRDGELLETSYSAIVAEMAGAWFTPEHPLLPSTKIASLRAGGGVPIQAQRITVNDLPRLQRLRLVNAMVDFEDSVDIVDIRWPGQNQT